MTRQSALGLYVSDARACELASKDINSQLKIVLFIALCGYENISTTRLTPLLFQSRSLHCSCKDGATH